ncbi:MAG: AsmA family protein [Desulfobacterales bacterium]
MKTVLKWVGLAVVCLAVIIIAALLILPRFIDARHYREPLEKMVSEASGRRFSVGNDVSLSLFPWVGVSFSDLRLGNPVGFAEPDFLTVETFDVRVKLLPLLSREVQVNRLVVSGPRAFLVTDKDGRVNYDFGPKAATQSKPDSPAPARTKQPIQSLAVEELSLVGGSIVLIDHKAGTRHDLSDVDLSLKDVSLDRPVQISMNAAFNQKPISARGRIGPVGQNLGKGQVPVEATVEAAGQFKLRVKGFLENLLAGPRADLTVDVAEFSPRKLMAEFGQSPPPTADPKTLERLAVKATVKAGADVVSFSDAVLELDQSKLNLSLTAKEFSRPNLAFSLTLDEINIDRYLPPPAEPKGPGSPSEAPAAAAGSKTDYGPLRTLIMDGSAKIGRLVVGKAKLEDVALKVTARDGMIAVDPFDLKLYQGKATGKTSVNVRGAKPVTEVQFSIDNVQANPLLKDLASKDFIEGTANARINLSMTGEDPARIKQTLNGRGSLDLSDGAIVGVDLAGMVRNVKTAFAGQNPSGSKPRTDFSELAVPFTIQNGVFRTPEALLRSPLLRLQAAGSADLVREVLDFKVEPKLVGTIKGQGDDKERTGLSVPILVSGSFSNPAFRPDLEAMAKEQLKRRLLAPGEGGERSTSETPGSLLRNILPGRK